MSDTENDIAVELTVVPAEEEMAIGNDAEPEDLLEEEGEAVSETPPVATEDGAQTETVVEDTPAVLTEVKKSDVKSRKYDWLGFWDRESERDQLHREYRESAQTLLNAREQKWDKELLTARSDPSRMKRWFRKGVPHKYRLTAWMASSGANELMVLNPHRYNNHLKIRNEQSAKALIYIDKDLFRTFPTNKHFYASPPVQKAFFTDKDESALPLMLGQLRRVLRALSVAFPDIGYCQGMSFIAAFALLVLGEQAPGTEHEGEEKIFWLVSATYLNLIPRYHSQAELHLMHTDLTVLERLLTKRKPELIQHLDKSGLSIPMCATKVFATLLVKVLPPETVFRVWDAFFNEGSKILFRVSLALFEQHASTILSLNGGELFQFINTLGENSVDADVLLKKAFKIHLSKKDIDSIRHQLNADIQMKRRVY